MELQYEQLVLKNENRLDAFIDQNEKLVQQQFGLNKPAPPVNYKPIQQTRKPWAQVAAQYEKKSREDYWKAKIESIEKETMNDTKVKDGNS